MNDRLSKLRKIAIIGVTGSGKTTFLENMAVHANTKIAISGDVRRDINLEEKNVDSFAVIRSDLFEESTTTISLNIHSFLFITTKSNDFKVFSLSIKKLPLPVDYIESVFPIIFFDLPGQERFSFMLDNGLKGADAVIIFADGTNVSSINRISHYISLIREQELKYNRYIPVRIFINKSDLKSKGIYVGTEFLNNWMEDELNLVSETTNFDFNTFMDPLRILLHDIPGFPMDINEILKRK